jgi:hypothetical protein
MAMQQQKLMAENQTQPQFSQVFAKAARELVEQEQTELI